MENVGVAPRVVKARSWANVAQSDGTVMGAPRAITVDAGGGVDGLKGADGRGAGTAVVAEFGANMDWLDVDRLVA